MKWFHDLWVSSFHTNIGSIRPSRWYQLPISGLAHGPYRGRMFCVAFSLYKVVYKVCKVCEVKYLVYPDSHATYVLGASYESFIRLD